MRNYYGFDREALLNLQEGEVVKLGHRRGSLLRYGYFLVNEVGVDEIRGEIIGIPERMHCLSFHAKGYEVIDIARWQTTSSGILRPQPPASSHQGP
jgi:hypothetical protein